MSELDPDTKGLLETLIQTISQNMEFQERQRKEDKEDHIRERKRDRKDMEEIRNTLKDLTASTSVIAKVGAENAANTSHINSMIDSIHDQLVIHDGEINTLKTNLAIKNTKVGLGITILLIIVTASVTWWFSTGKNQQDQTQALEQTMEGVNKTNDLMSEIVEIMNETYKQNGDD